jgi:hypothetical protein
MVTLILILMEGNLEVVKRFAGLSGARQQRVTSSVGKFGPEGRPATGKRRKYGSDRMA